MIEKIIVGERVNDMGKWVMYEDSTMDLIEPSELWIARQKELEVESNITDPTQEEYMMDLDYRLSVIELGL